MFGWFLLLLLSAVAASGAENCQNFETNIKLGSLREGMWFDQVRIYSGRRDYVSHNHPDDVVSMFLAKYRTNCGYFELNQHAEYVELFKGHDVPRFDTRFFTFKVQISQVDAGLQCKMLLAQRECKSYVNLTSAVTDINILSTDYTSYMIIHQCVGDRNYLMVQTKRTDLSERERIRIGNFVIDVMKERRIVIDNETFWWPTTASCDKYANFHSIHPHPTTQSVFRLVEDIYPDFYYHTFWDRRVQTNCSQNLPVELTDLATWLEKRNSDDEEARENRKKILVGSCVTVLGFIAIVGLVWLFNDNYKF